MKGLKRFLFVIKRTGLSAMLINFLIVMSIGAVLISVFEPNVSTIRDGYWYLFVSSTTIGFGDICVTTFVGKIVTIIVALYGIIVTAMIPGVVVTYYTEYLKLTEKETISEFLERLERLPELSHDELCELSEKIKKFRK